MKKCTGCGHLEHEPLNEALACCPDSRYRELTAMHELIERLEEKQSMWDKKTKAHKDIANTYYVAIIMAKKLLEKERFNIVRAVNKTNSSVICTLSGVKHDAISGDQYYNINFYNEND